MGVSVSRCSRSKYGFGWFAHVETLQADATAAASAIDGLRLLNRYLFEQQGLSGNFLDCLRLISSGTTESISIAYLSAILTDVMYMAMIPTESWFCPFASVRLATEISMFAQDYEDGSIPNSNDESTKNPIRVVLRDYQGPISREALVAIVASSRKSFHAFVGMTLKRRYSRQVPIYLVDDWVIKALGVFMSRGRRRLPSQNPSQVTRGTVKPGTFDFSDEIEGIGPWIRFFKALQSFDELLAQAQIIDLSEFRLRIRELSISALNDPNKRFALNARIQKAARIVAQVAHRLETSRIVSRYLNREFVEKVDSATRNLLEQLTKLPDGSNPEDFPEIPGISFDENRHSGILFGSIPDLEIEGPAILLSPATIIRWSQGRTAADLSGSRYWPGLGDWFGISNPDHAVAAVAISDVVHHELTHAMIALPYDPVQQPSELFEEHWEHYRKMPGFEEGLCNALAVLATGILVFKAVNGVKGPELPKLDHPRHAPTWERIFRSMRWLFEHYYGEETDHWLNALKTNKNDFGAFAGLVKMYSTNISGMDWDATYAAMQQGVIATTRTNQG